jgi:acyl-CoA synthetase (AMP-forming)/AMP-acid ligase II
VGELWVLGPQVMTGYYNDPQATAHTLGRGMAADWGLGTRMRTGMYTLWIGSRS